MRKGKLLPGKEFSFLKPFNFRQLIQRFSQIPIFLSPGPFGYTVILSNQDMILQCLSF